MLRIEEKEGFLYFNEGGAMVKRQISNMLGLEIPLVLVLFLLSGCATPSNAPKPQAQQGVLDDVVVFRDLQQVDLNNDGTKETVAIYTAGANSSGVKVIKFLNGKGDVIYRQTFNTPNVKFMMKDNLPTLMVEQKSSSTGWAMGTKSFYRWDGKAFTPAGKQ